MTFLSFCLTGRGYIGSYNLFLFWPVTLKSVKKKSIYACILINKISKKKKSTNFFRSVTGQGDIGSYNLFLFWPVTLKSVKKKSIYACILINKISKKKKSTIFFYFLPHRKY